MNDSNNNITQTIQQIRPSSRIISTIGKDLIKDVHAAIVELVKNSYDADSESVNILLEYDIETQKLKTIVSDKGHGMSFKTITDIWLVPATSDKLHRKTSPKGRTLQGRKGIGRYAAGILGNTLLLESTDDTNNLSKIIIDFIELEKAKYLSDVNILVETGEKNNQTGVYIEVTTTNILPDEVNEIWNLKQIQRLEIELRKLKSPLEKNTDDRFDISLYFKNMPLVKEIKNKKTGKTEKTIEYITKDIDITPLPILDFYDYRVHGKIDKEGKGVIYFVNQNLKNILPEEEKVEIVLDDPRKFCGDIDIDFRVFDRDPEAIDAMLDRGLRNMSIGKLEAKKLLDDIYGISIYRDIFRIRPYGDQEYDWLDLDKDRVQNPGFNIGMNQIAGFIKIQSEDISGLHEKSARDGLKENNHYFGLQSIAKYILTNILQPKRHIFRQSIGRGRKVKNINETINSLFDFDKMTTQVKNQLASLNITEEATTKIIDIIVSENKAKENTLKEIKDTIAVYQGQVTLGKLTEVLLHEGSKPLKYINEQLPRINRLIERYTASPTPELKQDILSRSNETVLQSKAISILFKRIQPLSKGRLPNKQETNLYNSIQQSFFIFESEFDTQDITFINSVDKEINIYGREYDLMTAFSNFFENSLYWLSRSTQSIKQITVTSEIDDNTVNIEFKDNGPGISEQYAQHVFDPGFSLKDGGTGLGLPIAAEALKRSDGIVSIGKSSAGAVLYIEFNLEKKDV